MVDNKYFVIDSHCHIYPEKIAEKAVANTDAFYGTKSFGRGTVEDLLENNADSGVDVSVVESVATTPAQVNSINEFISEKVKNSSGKLIGLGALHPDSTDIKGDVEKIKALGLKGVKLHPDIQNFKIDYYKALKIYEICETEHLPVLIHTGDSRYDNSNPNRLLPVLNIYKCLTVIGAHFGGYSVWEEASAELSGIPNLYVDCSSSFFKLTNGEVEKIINRYGADKVLFGTDYPMWSAKAEIKRFMSLNLTDFERKLIFSENAKKVFGIG